MVDIDFRNRAYMSRYSTDVIGLQIRSAATGELVDPDGNAITVTLTNEALPPAPVFSRAATRNDVGDYQVSLSSGETGTPGNYNMSWTYDLSGVADRYDMYFVVGDVTPKYDQLSPEMKAIADSVWTRFADCFDSPHGGPNLQTYFQTHWDRGRVADCMRWAVGRMNIAAQPYQSYTLDGVGGASFPTSQWGGLLEMATYVECLKHLCRSYLEQPQAILGGSVSRLDRRDYYDRWSGWLRTEEALLNREFEVFKIRNMGLGRGRALVSGGVFGRIGTTRYAGMVARPRLWTRFL
jgi:hypothetical protein